MSFKFIRNKIYRLHTAILYSMSNELIKIPNCVATVLRMDDEGHMWFQCKAPVLYLRDHEHSFPVRLHFFRKGFNYFADVSGSATIINLPDKETENNKDNMILFKVNVNNIEYTEPQTKMRTLLNEWIGKIYNWVLNHIALQRSQKNISNQITT